jgi:hypothetical protein
MLKYEYLHLYQVTGLCPYLVRYEKTCMCLKETVAVMEYCSNGDLGNQLHIHAEKNNPFEEKVF